MVTIMILALCALVTLVTLVILIDDTRYPAWASPAVACRPIFTGLLLGTVVCLLAVLSGAV